MKMMIVSLIFGLLVAKGLALTPHTNKGKIEEISLVQGMKELQLSEQEIKEVNKEFYGVLEFNSYFPAVQEADYESPVQIFKQTFQETSETIYRVVSYTKESIPTDRDGVFQKGYYSNGKSKPNLIFAEFYDVDATVFGQSITSVKVNNNFMPIIKKNRIAGIMIYGIERYNKRKSIVEDEGSSEIFNHKAAVYWSEDFSIADLRNTYSNSADIYIECSKPLVDEKDTFKYTIQNAFDKNPATSYVEDTEDDLMYIEAICPRITKFAIINGYAKNQELYKANNQILEVADEWSENSKYPLDELTGANNCYQLKKDTLIYQIIDYKTFSNGCIFVSRIQKGEKYSDTCIAELDFFHEIDGWLFGGIN